MTENREKMPDIRAVNPLYKGMTLGGMARLLTRPKSPAARAALDRIQGRSVTVEEREEGSG